MKQWFASLAPRERRVVVAGGVIVALIGGYLGVIEPIASSVEQRERRIASLEEQVEWMRGAAERVGVLQVSRPDAAAPGDRPAYIVVDRGIDNAGLSHPDQLEPKQSDGARLTYDAVAFDRLMGMVGDLRNQHGLQVTRARIERLETPGEVSARLHFEEL